MKLLTIESRNIILFFFLLDYLLSAGLLSSDYIPYLKSIISNPNRDISIALYYAHWYP